MIREFYDQALLDRFRPELRFDRQYDYRGLAAESMVVNPGNLLRRRDGDVVARTGGEPALTLELLCGDYPGGLPREATDCLCAAPDHAGDARRMEREPALAERLYGRCVQDDGRTWLQYWLWLYHNPKNLFGFGRHEGDWEMVQLGLGADGRPELAAYAQHATGEARTVREVELVDGAHPVVYVAPLSHAAYFEARTHPYLLGIDHPYGDGPRARPPVVPFGRWKDWPGRWGTTESAVLGGLGRGPASPACQGARWASPAGWQATLRRRRPRVLLGRLVWLAGKLTYPAEPAVAAERDGEVVRVRYRLGARGRHLYLTVNDGDRVLERRTVRRPAADGVEALIVPGAPERLTVWASAFNGLRQRSSLACTDVARA